MSPLLETFANASVRGFRVKLAGGAPYFMETIYKTSFDNYPKRLFVNAAGEYFVGGSVGQLPSFAGIKNNALGVIQWQRQLSVVGDPGALTVDGSGNVYTASNDGDIAFAKWDSAGTIQWQRRIYSGGGDYPYALKTDSSGNIYMAASYNGGNQIALNIKLNSSGTILWQRQYHNNSDCEYFDVALDSSDNQYYSGMITFGGGNPDLLITKYDSSGTFQWFNRFAGTAGVTDRGYGVAVDSSSNVFMAGLATNVEQRAIIIKLNSSGAYQWHRSLYTAGNSAVYRSVVTDAAGNIYAGGYIGNNQLLSKYDASGTIQWQRTISSGNADKINDLKIDSNGDLWLLSEVTQSTKIQYFVAKIPTNGSLTGTYAVNGVNYTYAASSLTQSSSQLDFPTYTPNPGPGTSGLSNAAGAKTENAASMTASTIKTIP